MQIITAPWREDIALRIARALEACWRRARAGARTWKPDRWTSTCPTSKAEVEAAFAHYEKALMANDVDGLQALFWNSTAHHPLRHRREPLRL